MVANKPPTASSNVFLDACAILNYVKPGMLNKLLPGRPLPSNATVIRDFMMKCGERKISFQSSDTVYEQVKKCRSFFRKELAGKVGSRTLERMISATEQQIKMFIIKRVQVNSNLPATHFSAVEAFFKSYKSDARLIELWKRKCQICGIVFPTPLPDVSDMQIFSQALNLPDLYFITTDGHFDVLRDELDKKFGSVTITDKNAFEMIKNWRW